MKILEIGGAGFVGSHLTRKLINEGHTVSVVDNLYTGEFKNVPSNANFYKVDARSQELEKVFKDENPEVLIYLAAQKSVPYSVKNPGFDADMNIGGLINTLEIATKNNLSKLIFFSTGALYGNTENIPTPETQEPMLISPYAISKFSSEKYIDFYSNLYGMISTIIRPANIYGPGQKIEGECGVIPIYIKNILEDKPSILYSYADMPMGVSRDFVFVEDVVNSVIHSMNYNQNVTFNISSGKETYMREIYDNLQEISGTNQPLLLKSERVGDVRRNSLDATRAQELLGWYAQVSLKEGLDETYKFEKSKLR